MVATVADAVAIIADVMSLPGNAQYVAETERAMRLAGVTVAVATRNTPILYRWLMDGFSYQAISDTVAASFISRHGNADWATVSQALAVGHSACPKLAGFAAYRGCGYRKTARTCANLEALPNCPVPSLPLRKGILNQQAFSLYLFIAERCGGDVVGFIDDVIGAGDDIEDITAQREALLAAFDQVQGVSRKLLSMMLSMLLIGGDPSRAHWAAVGQSMVAIDSLVHNFLHRTGILAAYGAHHPYGERCFGAAGCESIIRDLANRFDARMINRTYPAAFPRLVQYAIWRFCTVGGFDICNGKNIRKGRPCALAWCPLWSRCSRLPLVTPPDPAPTSD